MAHGDFGYSFQWQQPVVSLIGERLGLTLVLSLATLVFTWADRAADRHLLGRAAATRWATTCSPSGFAGLAVPGFLLGLVLMYIGVSVFHQDRRRAVLAAVPQRPVVVGAGGRSGAASVDADDRSSAPPAPASLIRIMRANLLDQLAPTLRRTGARQGAAARSSLLLRYPVRIALNPFVSTLGWVLPHLVSGSVIISIVLNLPTAGPMLLQALLAAGHSTSPAPSCCCYAG